MMWVCIGWMAVESAWKTRKKRQKKVVTAVVFCQGCCGLGRCQVSAGIHPCPLPDPRSQPPTLTIRVSKMMEKP
jgi:hypothetical protein